jgi:hypothetical protein
MVLSSARNVLVALMQENFCETIDRGMKQPPAEMDQLFHRLVWKGV